MLVLARKKNESIVIGQDIKVTVLEVRGNTVRLGLEAPSEVVILRSELLEKKTDGPAATTVPANLQPATAAPEPVVAGADSSV